MTSRATIVVVPRERWSFARRSLASIHADTEPGYDLVYVDGGSPEPVRHGLAADVARLGFRLVRTAELLSPNRARNLGAQLVTSEYTVFIDNDVVVEPGWLSRLVGCANETGAWIVSPLYCHGWPPGRRIHMAGGLAHVVEDEHGRTLADDHLHFDAVRTVCAPTLRRAPTEQAEFHCMLVRTDALTRLGPLDERLLSLAEHTDVCMLARAAGGGVWFEPAAAVTYVRPKWLRPSDVEFYRLRWSEAWNRRSVDHFAAKWRLRADDPWRERLLEWGAAHRCAVRLRTKIARAFLGPRLGYALARRVDAWLDRSGGGTGHAALGR
jgi:GT2 family glycosyltransferase